MKQKNISNRETLIKILMDNQKDERIAISDTLFTEWDLKKHNIVIQNKEYIKEVHTLKRPVFKTIDNCNYLVEKTIKKKITLFNQLKIFIKRGYYMSVKNNQLILSDYVSTFSFDLKKVEVS